MLEVGKYAAYVWNELQHKQILVQIMIYIWIYRHERYVSDFFLWQITKHSKDTDILLR
jgi:hypothetical protein